MNTVHLCWYDSSRFLPFFTCHFFHLLALKTKMRKTRLKCFAHGLAPLRTSATFHNSLSDEATARRVSTVPFVAYSRATRDLDFRRLMKNVADFLRRWGSFYVACLVFWKTFPVTWKVFAFFGGTSHGVSHVIIKAVESISPPNKNSLPKKKAQKKNLRNTCDTSSTIFSEIPSISPLHPPCLQMSRNLSLKAAQAADLNIKHTPEFYGDKKNWTNVSSSSTPPKKDSLQVSTLFRRWVVSSSNFWGVHVLPKNHQHNLGGPSKFVHHGFLGSQLESLPMSADGLGGESPQATNPKVKLGGFSRIPNNQTG